MKKGIAILTVTAFVVGLVGCVGNNNKADDNITGKSRTKNIAKQQQQNNPSGNPRGFADNGAGGYVSSPSLDRHVVFQSFSLYQPYESNMYVKLMNNSGLLKQWGITDVWMPPAYRAFSQSYYGEGYANMDRYDLGEFPQGRNGAKATKYGTNNELKKMIAKLHANRLRVQEDLVPNQMMGLPTPEIVSVTAVDQTGKENDPKVKDKLVEIYSRGGGAGQAKYGLIKEWNHTYYNGTGPQQLGMYRVMVDQNLKPYRYYGPNNAKNYLPAWLANSDAQKYGKINAVDGYLTADGYFAVKGANTANDQVWRPLLIYYVDPQTGATTQKYLDFMKANGFSGASDNEVRDRIIAAADNSVISKLTDKYLSSQPGYSAASEPRSVLRFNNGVNDHVNQNVLQYEFLIGNDIDNSNPTVQREQLNWAKFMMTQYGFDGFRIDAASHFNTKILTDLGNLMNSRYPGRWNDHLSYIESYTDNQVGFENNNRNRQLVYDHKLFGAFRGSLGKSSSASPLTDLINSSYINRTNPAAGKIPNWSFVNNHDQEHNVLDVIPLTAEEAKGAVKGTLQYEAIQFGKYADDMANVDKRYTPFNIPSQYAFLLTNKDTVPTVYYGDMYRSDKSYMSTKTVYHNTIVKLLQARQQYVSGDQKITYYPSNTSTVAGNDLLATVRYGTDRNTGAATVISNNPNTNAAINVDVGKRHAKQAFQDATGLHTIALQTDANGILTIPVMGMRTPLVNGYLAVWVPAPAKAGKQINPKTGKNGTVARFKKVTVKKAIVVGHNWQARNEMKRLKQRNNAAESQRLKKRTTGQKHKR
jgi:hypothetical protein